MAVIDPLSDMLTRIRNANQAYHEKVDVPSSRVKLEVARILRELGFIKNYKVVKNRKQGLIRIYLKYGAQKERIIEGLERISKPSLRVYSSSSRLPKILNGMGVCIISTSKGVMTDQQARQYKVGGEILCKIW